MAVAFDRVYSLTIGRNEPLIERTTPPLLIRPKPGVPVAIARPDYRDFNVSPQGAITLTDLQMTAEIEVTKEEESNKQGTTITVYNLSRKNQRFLKAGDTVLLRAGYRSIHGDNPPLIFSGQATKIVTTQKNENSVTTIECSASEIPRRNIKFSKSPVKGETTEDVVKFFASVAADNGVPEGNIFVAPPLQTYPSGYPAYGSLFPIMEKYCSEHGLNCYVTLGRLYIEPKRGTIPATPRIRITKDQIKGTIRPESDPEDSEESAGVSLTVVLNGNITPSTTVFIADATYGGDYSITSVNHKLNFEGNAWDTVLSCRRREEREKKEGTPLADRFLDELFESSVSGVVTNG